MMQKKGMSTLMDNVLYLILLGVFLAMIALFLWSRSNGADLWADFYSKELSRIVSAGHAGDSYRLNVQDGTAIAARNGLNLKEVSSLFAFDAQKHQICVTLSTGNAKCHPYFSNLAVSDVSLELGVPTNFISFKLQNAGGANAQ